MGSRSKRLSGVADATPKVQEEHIIMVTKSALALFSVALLAAAFARPASAQDSQVTSPLAVHQGLRASSALPATTFTTLHSFNGTDGAYPFAGLLAPAPGGKLYGTTVIDGANGDGTVFYITYISPNVTTPVGTLMTVHSFNGTDGAYPYAGPLLAVDGDFYGTTSQDGASAYGTVFKMTPSGTLMTLHSFNRTDGAYPEAGLVQATDGNLYGTTEGGGTGTYGTVFKITPSGTLTTLYNFCSQFPCADGAAPHGVLVQGTDGNLYGTTLAGGTSSTCDGGCGTVFKITTSGTLTTLHSFVGSDGVAPFAGLVQATDGNFYGTTYQGGTSDYGTVFKITPNGTLTTLYNFCSQIGCTDGAQPYAGVIQATDGNFYGTTVYGGGTNNYGTVFKVTPSGTLTTLHTFNGPDGSNPNAGVVQAANGVFYGTTVFGGANGDGTVFSLSVSLGPLDPPAPISVQSER